MYPCSERVALQTVCSRPSIYRRMHVSRRVNRAAQFFARREPRHLADGPSEMDTGHPCRPDEALFHLRRWRDGRLQRPPRQFDDITLGSGPLLFAGAKAKHARAPWAVSRAFRCSAFADGVDSRGGSSWTGRGAAPSPNTNSPNDK